MDTIYTMIPACGAGLRGRSAKPAYGARHLRSNFQNLGSCGAPQGKRAAPRPSQNSGSVVRHASPMGLEHQDNSGEIRANFDWTLFLWQQPQFLRRR